MIVYTAEDVPQRSEAWHALRAGKVTGSCAPALLAVRQRGTGELAVRRDLRQRLVVERLTGIAVDEVPYKGKDLQHGIDCEPEAVFAYEAQGDLITRVGFVAHDELAAGCSPDGYVGDWEGIVEVKCPASSTHVEYWNGGGIPKEYYGQLLHSLWITGAQWADFCSFDPRMPAHRRLFTKRLTRDGIDFLAYELAVRNFLSEIEREVAVFRGEPVPAEMTPEEVHHETMLRDRDRAGVL